MKLHVDASAEGQVVEAGVDWLTVTASDADGRLGLGVSARRQARTITQSGNEVLPWSFSGYQGFRTRGLQWGERYDSTIVRASSDVARWHWWEFLQLSERVTRCDWQVTHRSDVDPYVRVLDHHREARKFWKKRRDGPTVTLIADNRRGATLYLGKRQSRIMLRCYNKAAESKSTEYAGCVRYEVEMKERVAQSMMAAIASGIDFLPAVIATVREMFVVRGVTPAWNPESLPLAKQWSTGPTDVERKRMRLRAQVRPSVEFLVEHVGMAAVAEDLGLQAFADAGFSTYRPLPDPGSIRKGE